MSKPFWSTHLNSDVGAENLAFCAGRDVTLRREADGELLEYDIWTNQVSVIALFDAKIITKAEGKKLHQALKKILKEYQAGKWQLDPALEDVHMNIEVRLGKMVGTELAGKIHTGRSRNDQSATDLRLLMRKNALDFQDSVSSLISLLLQLAAQHSDTICPGFSHGQPAMVTTYGHLLLSYVQALLRDLERFAGFYKLVNRSPLGAAAGFGTSWPLNRDLMALCLGFNEVEENSLDAVGSRGELESMLAFNLSLTMNHLSTMANDLYFMAHPYVEMVSIDDSLVTGSSIMPQKKNPDLLEVLRAKTTCAHGYLQTLLGLGGKNLSGYNRDFQWAKYPLLDLLFECLKAPVLMRHTFASLTIHTEKMRELANLHFLNAVEVADLLARSRSLSFRQGYQLAGLIVKDSLAKKKKSLDLEIITKVLKKQNLAPLTKSEQNLLQSPLKMLNNRKTSGGASSSLVKKQIETMTETLEQLNNEHKINCQYIDLGHSNTTSYFK